MRINVINATPPVTRSDTFAPLPVELFEPWPDGYTINARSPYGPRVHPITRVKRIHHGVDVAMPTGTQLTAPADGVVVHKGTDWHTLSRVGKAKQSAGNNLILRHPDDWHTVFYHLQKRSHLRVGDEVKAGDLIGLSGNTGGSTGPHLHFELRESRTWGDTTDPAPHFVGKYKAPAPEPVEPEPIPEPVEPEPTPEPVTPVERPTIQPKPRPTPVTPKPRPTVTPKPRSPIPPVKPANPFLQFILMLLRMVTGK